jgi:hypothetical protein
LTMLYRSTDRLSRRGAPMENLAHNESFQSDGKAAPSNSGIKQLAKPKWSYWRAILGAHGLSVRTAMASLAKVRILARALRSLSTLSGRSLRRPVPQPLSSRWRGPPHPARHCP